MGNFPREYRGKYRGCGGKISDYPAGWEFNCRKSRGSGRNNRELTAGDIYRKIIKMRIIHV